MQTRFLFLMASVMLVDLAITGIFIAVSGRLEVLGTHIFMNVLVLGAGSALGGWRMFAPVQALLCGNGDFPRAQATIEALPGRACAWVVACTVGYCVLAFSLGVFMPDNGARQTLSSDVAIAGVAWFGFLYALYYGFYVYFAVSDFVYDLKFHLSAKGFVFRPGSARFVHKLLMVFGVASVIPSALIALDLSVFRELRAAQGLTVEQTIFLDLLASAFLITVSLFFVTRSLVRPINALMARMDASADSRLDVRAPVMSSDELGVLAERFNQMLDGLRDREFIRETFGRYVPKKVAATLLDQKGMLEPHLQTATILFADIEGFTKIVESHPPGTVLRMLNEYFSTAIEPINRMGGVVNQFQGDAMLVTFNVPVEDPSHADNAVAAALEIQQAVAGKRFAGIPLRARIGINTGEVIAGTVGSDDRLNYTVHGDAVNVAARLEALNKDLGTQVLVSGTTVEAMTNSVPLRSVGDIAVRGRSDRVATYTLDAPNTVDAEAEAGHRSLPPTETKRA